ncbi:hypothetical protein DEO72_LG11g1180 [Vigna unguiculata]|uniref:Uncharacterized protein n=1 Tax=Vigna unguiculata TaxID=3917 RepID=A0A4D6NMG8_VIGUN|nr:hypothetical protein DEO72_LG11g1180 [Vigna unguiculata]
MHQAFGLGSLRTEAIKAVKIPNSRAPTTIHRLPQVSSLCANLSALPPPPRSTSFADQHPPSIVVHRRLRRAVQVHRLQITSRRGGSHEWRFTGWCRRTHKGCVNWSTQRKQSMGSPPYSCGGNGGC